MFIFPRGLLLLACLVAVPCTHANEEPVMPTSETPILPPVAPKHPHTLKKHGDVRIDNYYWLRDDERQKPEVLDYLVAHEVAHLVHLNHGPRFWALARTLCEVPIEGPQGWLKKNGEVLLQYGG